MDKQQEVARIKNGVKILFWICLLVLFAYSFHVNMDLKEMSHPGRQKSFLRILTALSKPNISEGETSRQVVEKMWETIQIAFLATTISAVLAIPFTFFSARHSTLWGRGLNILLQPILSAVRSVHPLFVTIPIMILTGIGPTAGVLALAFFSTAVLATDFSEYAQKHMSLSWLNLFQVYFPGLAFRRLPVNMLIATVLGFTGGGGIGFFLQQQIRILKYGDVSVAILACIITVGSLDLLSRFVWHIIQNHRVSLESIR